MQLNTVAVITVKTLCQSKDTSALFSFPLQHPKDKNLSLVTEIPVDFHFLSIVYSVEILESN